MKNVIWGAGAIGGTLGAKLTRAGQEVLLVDAVRAHIERMNREGLYIEDNGRSFLTKVNAALYDEVSPTLDLVFLAVKSQHTGEAVERIKPLLGDQSVVVSCQNGLNEERIARDIGEERTLGALVNFSADYISPGHILYGGGGSLILGELDGRVSDRLRRIADFLNKAMKTAITDNLWGYKWGKTCYGSLGVATALVDEAVYEIVLYSDAIQEMLIALVCELLEVAEAYGIRIEPFDEFLPEEFSKARAGSRESQQRAMKAVADFYRTNTKGKTGIWMDMAVKKRKTEVDAVIGMVVNKGEEKGLSCPLNRKLIQLIHEIEEGQRPMQWKNLDELIEVYHSNS